MDAQVDQHMCFSRLHVTWFKTDVNMTDTCHKAQIHPCHPDEETLVQRQGHVQKSKNLTG